MSSNALTTRDNSGNAVTISSTDVGSGVQAMNHRVCDATAANFLPTMDAAARAGYIIVTDGTHNLPVGDAAARKIFTTTTDGTNTITVKAASTLAATTDTSLVVQPLQASDGTHTTPIGDAQARAIQIAAGDGTNGVTVKAASTSAVATDTSLVVQINPQQTPPVSLAKATTGGATPIWLQNLAATVEAIKASAGTLYGLVISNEAGATAFVQIFNTATGSVTLGTTSPVMEIAVPSATTLVVPLPSMGVAFGTAISIASTTAEKGSVGSASGVVVTALYA